MPPTTGDVEVVIQDNGGAVVVPSASTMLVMGCSSAGVAGQVVASRNVNNLIAAIGYGPLTELCAMLIARGGTVLAVKTPSNTAGANTAVVPTALTGTSTLTLTGTPNDTYYVKVVIVKGGTIGAAGIQFQVSLDAGRTYGPVLALPAITPATYVIPNTGITLSFAAGTLITAAYYTFKSTEPKWNTAGIQAALGAFQASQYALLGVGGSIVVGDMSVADAATVNGYLETLALGKIFTAVISNQIDASPAAAWSGTAQSEAAWTTAIADTSSLDAKRMLVAAGHYNMPSQIPNTAAGAPRYRRPYAWALACRQVQIAPQRHAGRVRDGALLDIIVDPTGDPQDGFIYHDERLNPGLKASRYAVARTRIKKSGFFADDPLLMSGLGSVFTMLPFRNVMDVGCGIIVDVGQRHINQDIRLNKNGTIYENEARKIESEYRSALRDNMFAAGMISGFSAAVDRTNNIRATSKVKTTVSLESVGYILEENVTIGFDITE